MQREKISRLNETEQWIVTAEAIGVSEYSLEWSTYKDDLDIIPEIQESIIGKVTDEIDMYNEDFIKSISKLHPSARTKILQIIPLEYRGFFEYEHGQFPIELSCPIPFFPYEDRLGERVVLTKQIILRYGKSVIKVRNILCKPDDIKVWVALNQIRKKNLCLVNEEKRTIILHVQYSDIAKELGYQNPWTERVHKIIRSRLERLREMSLVWECGRKFYSGALLGILTNLDCDSENNIEIHMDKFFIELMKIQFNGFNEKQLYSLSGKPVNIFIYLNRDKGFNKFGVFDSRKYNQKVYDIYDLIGLQNPMSEPLSNYKKSRMVRSLLDDLVAQGIIYSYRIEEGFLHVERHKS